MDENTSTILSSETQEPTEEDIAGLVLDDVGDALEAAYEQSVLRVENGQLITGKVVQVLKDEILLDVGYKSEGVIPSRELSLRTDIKPSELVSVGEELEALVLQKEDREGRLLLSKKRAQYEKAWNQIEEVYNSNQPVVGTVIEIVKGGLILDVGLRGFLPASLIEMRRVKELDPYMGQEIKAKILELDRNRNNVVLSRRAYLEETQKEEREKFLDDLNPGELRKGTVSSIVAFGAFVDIGGMDGLVHVSELSWKHIDHPSEVVSVGDEVEVRVLGIDMERERIGLSLKVTQQGPWEEFADTHKEGELVYGRVSKIVPFGAFVQVGDDIEGLVHISEIATQHINKPEEVISPGEELWVKILEIDPSRRRISLSIKQAQEGGEVAAEYQEYFSETTVETMPETETPDFPEEAALPEEEAGETPQEIPAASTDEPMPPPEENEEDEENPSEDGQADPSEEDPQ